MGMVLEGIERISKETSNELGTLGREHERN